MLLRDKVILVNDRDEWLNTASKEEAHRTGLLHRALSIFIVNSDGEMLLQRRALHKYHSGGLWSNTCCSHPTPGESAPAAAHRRLQEELGFDTPLTYIGAITYRAALSNGLIEHEYDHILSGSWDGTVYAQPEEVSETRWIPLPALHAWMQQRPEDFSAWFPLALRFWMEHVPGLLTAS